MSWDDLSRNEMSWPSVAAVNAYRRLVFVVVQNVIERHSCFEDLAHAGEPSAHPSWSLYMAFEHERIHLETSSVLIRELPMRLVSPPSEWQPPHESALKPRGGATHMPVEGTHYPANSLLAQPGGEVRLGKDAGDPFFGWDNEYGVRVLQVGAFSATKLMVSNAEFYLFVRDLGYHEPSWWSEEGWKWRSFRNAKQPPFWVPEGPAGLHCYALRLLFHLVPMPWALPCIVNVHEARAYAAWRAARDGLAPGSLRLLTEPEHHLLRDRTAGATHNVSLAFGSECDVDVLPTAKPSGVHDAMGNVWCWCEDHFSALPGFTVSRLYEGAWRASADA
jgi:formylglycine-generating enzyme required for sulfatase activity